MKTLLFAVALALTFVGATPAQSPTKATAKSVGLGKTDASSAEEANIRAYIELLRTDIRTSKAQVLALVMELDAGQATKFWPIYKEFEGEYSNLVDKILVVVKQYAEQYDNLTDPGADKLATQVLDFEEQRNTLKRTYYGRVKGALGGVTAMRFLQVENQLERLIDLQVAAHLPVAGER